MARFDVHRMPHGNKGYLVNVQADLLMVITTKVVLPLLPLGNGLDPATQLNPVFEIEGQNHVLVTQAISAVSMTELGKVVASLADRQDEIVRALDTLLTGF